MSRTLKKLIRKENVEDTEDFDNFPRNFGKRGAAFVTCDECGKRFRARYKPSRGRPFLCRECAIKKYSKRHIEEF